MDLQGILEGCKKGDRKCQHLLYSTFASRMMGVCMRYAKTLPEAEDVLQNGFIKVFTKIDDFRQEGSLEGWIRTIMVRAAIESYHKEKRKTELVDISDLAGSELQSHELVNLEARDLLALVQQLSPGCRLVFNLYAIEGYSHKEIAGQLGISESASKAQLSRARTILKSKLAKMEELKYEYCAG